MQRLPTLIRKDILTYALPLFLMNLSRTEFNNKDYWLAIPGCILAWAPIKSKPRLVVSSLLYLLHVFMPSLYFLCLGFILHQAYNSNILISKNLLVCSFTVKIEIIGLLCSEFVTVPAIIKLILGSLAIFISITCAPPSVECSDPFESMKAKIDSSNMLNMEYRSFISMKRDEEYLKDAKLFFTEILYMISERKFLVLFCSFFSFEKFELVIILIGVLFIFGCRWEYLCIILKAEATSNVLFRVCGTYTVYLVVSAINQMTVSDIKD